MNRLSTCLLLIIALATLAFGINACQSAPQQSAEKSAAPLRILETIEVDSVVADFPVGFQFLTSGEWQFIGYYNKHRELTVASRKIPEKEWTYKVLPTRVGWDSHNRISMALDRDHCLHLSGNMHNDTLIYFKTERPYDIGSFTQVFPMVSAPDEWRCTYPNFTKNGEDALIFSYRKGGSGNGITITNLYDESTKSFKRLTDQPLFDGRGLMSAYPRGPLLGPDEWFHIIWFWRDTPGCETNHDLSYARSPDLVSWETADGQSIALPITPEKLQLTVDPVPPKGGAINGGAVLFFDTAGQPLIAYMKYDPSGNSQIYLAALEEGQWVSKQISNWEYRWAFSGSGSITFEIRLESGYTRPDGKIAIPYYHIKRGNGTLIVDRESLTLEEDRPVDTSEDAVYPTELLSATSSIDSASVHWLTAPVPSEETNHYYALRWETMGKRRFYEPREKPVKPSVMKLYHLVKEE